MRIKIEEIDTGAMQPIGYTQLPSFPVRFSSPLFEGRARFVPADAGVQQCLGQVYDVEINQEDVSNFTLLNAGAAMQAVVALPESAAFHVSGVVASVTSISEPPGERLITVRAKDAFFTLSQADVGSAVLSIGDAVSFVAHEVSLWDEAI